jgi:hypothetical protein
MKNLLKLNLGETRKIADTSLQQNERAESKQREKIYETRSLTQHTQFGPILGPKAPGPKFFFHIFP